MARFDARRWLPSGAAAVVVAHLLGACTPSGLHPDYSPPFVCRLPGPPVESLFLIGDAGEVDLPAADAADPTALVDPVLLSLAADVRSSLELHGSDRTAVVFLGDNVYPAGLPVPGEAGRAHAERLLEAQISAVGDAQGYFLLGNHDWNQGKPGGYARALAQADYLAKRAPNISIHPPAACAGPDGFAFADHFELIFFDLWAAMYQVQHPNGVYGQCAAVAVPGKRRLADEIDRLLDSSGNRRTVFIAHPPMLTSGPHGGYFPWQDHLFPLRMLNRDLWIPLPVIGSIFPLSRQLGVTNSDMMSRNYQNYLNGARALFRFGHPTLVAAGHEHSLQIHVDRDGIFHAVSGAGSTRKVDYVREMRSELMSLAAPGYMRVDAYDDGKLLVHVTALGDRNEAERVYTTCIP